MTRRVKGYAVMDSSSKARAIELSTLTTNKKLFDVVDPSGFTCYTAAITPDNNILAVGVKKDKVPNGRLQRYDISSQTSGVLISPVNNDHPKTLWALDFD